MKKYIHNSTNGLWYEQQGDFYIPCLVLSANQIARPIGMWGRRHLRYIKEYRPVLYNTLALSGELHAHLADIEDQTQCRYDQLVEQMAQCEGITEELKANDPMTWVGAMNNIRDAATEIVNAEVIFA